MRLSTLAALAASASVAVAVNQVAVQEQEFIDTTTKERFVILGVDYQTTYGGTGNNYDPLSDPSYCLRDAALLQALGVNTIRVYQVNPTLNHDECMSIFNTVGIYLLLDVNSGLPGQALDRSAPWTTYDLDYLNHIFSVVEGFKSYPNLLGFFAGNEIINDVPSGRINPPYIRAVQRDLKNYIAAHAPRTIPVGYSAAQVESILQDTWAYLQCNNSNAGVDMSRSDFFGLNSYSWCGNASSFQISGYDNLVDMFGNTTIPVFFSEYGCNVPLPRYFDEVPVLYGPEMTSLSGGLVYEWQQATNNYGLMNQNSNGSGSLLPDFYTLAAQYNKLNISLIEASNNTATNLQPPKCNPSLLSSSSFSHNFTIPDPPPGAAELISKGVSSAPTGTIVSVSQTSVTNDVYATDGSLITGLKITPVSAANHPGGSGLPTNVGAATTGTGAAPTESKKSSAHRIDAGAMGGALAAGVLGVMLL